MNGALNSRHMQLEPEDNISLETLTTPGRYRCVPFYFYPSTFPGFNFDPIACGLRTNGLGAAMTVVVYNARYLVRAVGPVLRWESGNTPDGRHLSRFQYTATSVIDLSTLRDDITYKYSYLYDTPLKVVPMSNAKTIFRLLPSYAARVVIVVGGVESRRNTTFSKQEKRVSLLLNIPFHLSLFEVVKRNRPRA